jgi:DNA-binding NarL/FixJ family response regulator
MSLRADTIRIAYAEDHALIRKSICEYIKSFPGCVVVLEAKNGKELIEQMEKAEDLPNMCLLDIFMPEMNGLEALLEIKKRWPEMKSLVLTANSTEYYLPQVLRAGANGFLMKDCEPEELENAIRSIYANGIYTPDLEAYKFYRSVLNKEAKLPELTDIEVALLQFCCSDLSYVQIAEKMHTTPHSVDWHRLSLFKKLNVKSRSSLVMYAIQFGLVELNIDVTSKSLIAKPKGGRS